MEALPGSKLRSLCLDVLVDDGYVGPPYNLDDISADISPRGEGFYVSFWDMSTFVSSKSKRFASIVEEYNKALNS